MPGLFFEEQATVAESSPNRMDVALFIGFVRVRDGFTVPPAQLAWLKERGWAAGPYSRPLDSLLDVPVPIESWQQFQALFDEQQRSADGRDGATYLGAALRSFFAQGGRRCYVVRAGDPWPLSAPRVQRLNAVSKLIPGYRINFLSPDDLPSPEDRSTWRGIGHLFGLPDVSFVCLPDLGDAVAVDRKRIPLPDPPPGPPEQFVECSETAPLQRQESTVRDIGAPRCDEEGYAEWARAIDILVSILRLRANETQLITASESRLIAALPIPADQAAFQLAPASPFVQVAYPWARTPGSSALPDQLESPDGVLAGILARNALVRGTFRGAAGLHMADVYDLYPDLDRHQQQQDRLIERACLIGPTPAGLRLLSDVTLSSQESYRPGGVSRLVATIVRSARRIGEDVTFESSGARLWGDIRSRLDAFFRGLFNAGAFRGASPGEAYDLRCDSSTMSQNDIDNGRVVAYVQFAPAAPVDTITVELIVNAGNEGPSIQNEVA